MHRDCDDRFFSDVLTTAVNGGIGHWAVTRNVERFEYCYVRLEVKDIEGEMDWQMLDTSVIVEGINRICRGGLLAKQSERVILQAAELQVAGLINPYLSDYITQVGLFGEIAYP
jgi:hypothetical protein